MKDFVAMYKKPEDNSVDSFESEDVQTPTKRLRKVDIGELDFEALCDVLGNGRANRQRGIPWFRREALKSMPKPP